MCLSKEKIELIENEIEKEQRTIKYDTKEYTIELIVSKYLKNLDDGDNEFYVPDYQREFVWDNFRQSRFIESLMIGLPIPYIFLAADNEGKFEIVDGSQRIRTLAAYLNDDLTIHNLDKLKELNNLKFTQLTLSRQRKFINISLKMICLSAQTTEESKNDIFERINRGSDLLKDMESRKGIYRGKFNDFLYSLAQTPIFIELTPIATWFENRQEREELLLRFFALTDLYPNQYEEKLGIARQLDKYFQSKNKPDNFLESEEKQKKAEFMNTMNFIKKVSPYGFSKGGNHQVSRVFFEAISVGTILALREKPTLSISQKDFLEIINNQKFKTIISGKYHTHTPKRITSRINYIKEELLNGGKSI